MINLLFLTALLAEIPGTPPDGYGQFMSSVLYTCGAIFFLLGGIEKIKSIFGRKPALNEEFDSLGKKIVEVEVTVRKEIAEVDRRRSVGIAGCHAKIDTQDTGVQTELRLMNARISETEVTLGRLDERSLTTIHAVDSINDKIDRALSK